MILRHVGCVLAAAVVLFIKTSELIRIVEMHESLPSVGELLGATMHQNCSDQVKVHTLRITPW